MRLIHYIATENQLTMSSNPTIHEGQQLKEFREMLGVKQDVLAHTLGDDWDQKKISRLEEKEKIDDELMAQVAAALKVKPEAIRNFNKERAIYHIQNNHEGAYSGATNFQAYQNNYQCTFNPLDKLMESIEDNKKLYERMIELLQKMADKK